MYKFTARSWVIANLDMSVEMGARVPLAQKGIQLMLVSGWTLILMLLYHFCQSKGLSPGILFRYIV